MRSFAIPFALMILLSGCAADPAPVAATDPTTDSDADGVPDSVETRLGTDPFNATDVPVLRVQEAVTFSGDGMIIGGNELFGVAGTCGGRIAQDTAVFTWLIEAPKNTTGARVSALTFTATYPATMPEGDIYVFDPEGNQLTDSTGAAIPPTSTDTVRADGVLPAGEYRIEVRGCLGAGNVQMDAEGVLSYLRDPTTL